MGKIGDLWVKLGLKKDEFSRGMKEAGNETSSFASKVTNMSKAAKLAWAAVGAAVAKFAKDAVKMTQKWGDQWNETMAGIKGAYSSFVRQISSGDGWNHLFANMREAFRVSKEVAAALDEIFERKTSFSYQEADTERQIAQLQLIARDSSKSEAERIAANKKIIELTNTLGDSKKKIYQDEAANQRRLFQLQTGLNDEQTDYLVKEYNQNREAIKQAREYLRVKKELSSVGGQDFFTESVGPIPTPVTKQRPISPELEKLERETPQAIKDIAELTKMYDRGNDELVKGMAEAEVAVIRIDTETMHAQTRATALLGSLQKVTAAGGESGATQAQKILQRAEDSAKSEIRLLAEKYREEKALLERYGMDTSALYEEYARKIADALDVELPDPSKVKAALDGIPDDKKVTVSVEGPDTRRAEEKLDQAFPDEKTVTVKVDAEVPEETEVKDQAYTITPEVEKADIPQAQDQTYEVTPQVEAADVPEVKDQTYKVAPEVEAPDVPAVEVPVEVPDVPPVEVGVQVPEKDEISAELRANAPEPPVLDYDVRIDYPDPQEVAEAAEGAVPKMADAISEESRQEIDALTAKYSEELAMLEEFGLDTSALTIKLLEDISSIIDDWVGDMEPVKLEPLEVTLPDMSEWDEFYQDYQERLEFTRQLLEDFRDSAIGGFSDAIQELANQFAGLEDINPGKVVQALLTPLADMAIKEGEILIAEGVGVEACKEALESLNGYAAIAAGTALVAIGAAAKAGLSAMARQGASSTATTSYAGASAGANNLQTIQTELTVYVTGLLSGSDILLSGKKTQDNLNR